MKIKHKLLNDFQYVDDEKKIITLKKGTILEDYLYKTKTERVNVDKEIVNSNPDYFQFIDWKLDLLAHIKSNKIPQPSQIQKKILPFIEELLNSFEVDSNSSDNISISESYLEEIKEKEEEIKEKQRELTNREKRLLDKEEEISIRLKRIEKREEDYKSDLMALDSKEDDICRKKSELTEKELDIEDKIQDLNRKERNLDQQVLESSKNIDQKYLEIQEKIKNDLQKLSDKEKQIELEYKEFNKSRNLFFEKEAILEDKIRKFEIKEEELKMYGEELKKLDDEIKDWEGLHWKFKRMRKPPSVEK
jgi:N-terminal acetyltransferase B complex non-catalytic subunit